MSAWVMNAREKPAVLSVFADPMMGLLYECQPLFRKLELSYGAAIAFRFVCAGLVRDVSDFMTPLERSLPEGEGIPVYCRRLADIYRSEEALGGLPIRMEGFNLFDAKHRSSAPLNLAYEVVRLADPSLAEAFLYRLQYETIARTEKTTEEEKLLRIAEDTGLDRERVLHFLRNGEAAAAFQADLALTKTLGIHSLPALLVSGSAATILLSPLDGWDAVTAAIRRASGGSLKPKIPRADRETLVFLLEKHPLISLQELQAAFGFGDEAALRAFLTSNSDSVPLAEEDGFFRRISLFSDSRFPAYSQGSGPQARILLGFFSKVSGI